MLELSLWLDRMHAVEKLEKGVELRTEIATWDVSVLATGPNVLFHILKVIAILIVLDHCITTNMNRCCYHKHVSM